MARPGFTLVTDDRTPALLALSGAGLGLERFPGGTQVVYGAEPTVSRDPASLVDQALESPVGAAPLASQLTTVKRLTVVVADHGRPQPGMRFDVRRTIVERVLETAARAGVDDVGIVIAAGLGARWSDRSVLSKLGERVGTSFLPDGLVTSHDVTAADLAELGEVAGAPARINRRVAESDLVVVVDVVDSSLHPHQALLNLADADTINRVAGAAPQDAARDHLTQLLLGAVAVFGVSAVLGPPRLGRQLAFVNKREWEWRLPEYLAYAAARQLLAGLPAQGPRSLYTGARADYAVADLIGGHWPEVTGQAHQVWAAANTVSVPRLADVLVAPVWGPLLGSDAPEGNPLLAQHHALVQRADAGNQFPLVRQGGVLIALHPLRQRFSHREAAAADLFATTLAESLDPATIQARFEPEAARDEWYLKLYREHQAAHPLRELHRLYRAMEAARHFSEVIWVGADRASAALLGHRAATTCADAMEIAADRIGTDPLVTLLRGPGPVLGATRPS